MKARTAPHSENEPAVHDAMCACVAAPQDCRVNLLWTGGWDSTFRLLQLLLVHRMVVIPYYLEDPTRASTTIELETMERIRAHLFDAHPHTRALLRPLRRFPVDDIVVDADTASALQAIRKRSYIGDQYAWLPAFCEQHAINDIELGVHVDDRVQALLRSFAMEFAHPGGFHSMRVDPRHAGTAEHCLFRYFSFPLFHIDKVRIGRQAEAEGWSRIMEMTWFCHTPVQGRPCGLCAPCVYTIEEGLAHRIPLARRLPSFFYRRFVRPLKDPLRQLRMAARERLADRQAAASRPD